MKITSTVSLTSKMLTLSAAILLAACGGGGAPGPPGVARLPNIDDMRYLPINFLNSDGLTSCGSLPVSCEAS